MGVLPGVGGPVGGAKKVIPIQASFLTSFSAGSSAGETNYTSPSINFGADAPNRKLLVGVFRQGSANVNSMTLAGNAMTLLYAPPSSLVGFHWYILSHPSGASGVLNNVMSTSTARGFGVWRLIGAGALYDSADAGNAGPNPSVAVNVKKGGALFAGARANSAGTALGSSWTGVTHSFGVGPIGTGSTRGAAGMYLGGPESGRTVSLATSLDARLSAISLEPE